MARNRKGIPAAAWFYGNSFHNHAPEPTSEQLDALTRFAAANGRNWKSALNNLWMTGAYSNAVLGGADSGLLQQVRNQFGPSWLVRFSLKGIPPQRETGLPGGNLTSPMDQSISSSSIHAQYSAEPGGEYVFTCRSCGSPDLSSLWGSGFLDEPTRCNACGAKTYEDPDCTLHFPEFCPDYAVIAPYTDEPAVAPEVAA